jgi:hypothetical protein
MKKDFEWLDQLVCAALLKRLGAQKGVAADDGRLVTEVFNIEELGGVLLQMQKMPFEEKIGMWLDAMSLAERQKLLKKLEAKSNLRVVRR